MITKTSLESQIKEYKETFKKENLEKEEK